METPTDFSGTPETPFVGVSERMEAAVDEPVKVNLRPLIMLHPISGVILAEQMAMSTEHFLPLVEMTVGKIPSKPAIGVLPKA